MKIPTLLLSLLLASPAWAQTTSTVPLLTNGPITVTNEDFEAFLLRAPEAHRPELRASMDRIGKALEIVYSNRVLAEEAKKAGLDKDPLIRLRIKQIEEGYLAQLWKDSYRKSVVVPDLSKRAEELYNTNREKYVEPDRFSGKAIVILKRNRTSQEAVALATELRAKVVAGAKFDDVMKANSEDPQFGKNLGRIGRVSPKDLEPPLAEAVFALKSPGDITPPVETADAVYVVQMERKVPGAVRPFSGVKRELESQEREKVIAEATERRIGELKNTEATKVYSENISALKRDLPRVQLEEISRKPPAGAPKR
jgi:peptidyl-prolyl cis-trans isomerase C